MKNISKIACLLTFIAVISYFGRGYLIPQGLCLAQEQGNSAILEADKQPDALILYIDELKSITIEKPSRVAINNPEVVDVVSVSSKEILVIAKETGSTTLSWWGKDGEQHALSLRVFAKKMNDVKSRIDNLLSILDLPNVHTQCVDSEGKVILLGQVKTQDDIKRIKTALGPLMKDVTSLIKIKEREESIEIDVQILELNKGWEETLGFTPPFTAMTMTEPTGKYGNNLVDVPDALFHMLDWPRASVFSTTLNMLEGEGKARILSRPRLVCQTGKEANLLVGGEIPILTTKMVATGTGVASGETTVEYKPYGIKLSIRPVLLPNGKINIGLDIDVSELQEAVILGTIASPTVRAYPTLNRQTSTQLVLENGQTMAMSGLIKQKTEESLQKFPWLSDVPVLGMFFRSKTSTKGGGRTDREDIELVVTLTPTLLKRVADVSVPKKEPVEEVTKEPLEEEEQIQYVSPIEPAINSYTRKIIKRIQDNFAYPPEAYEKGIEGATSLSLTISNFGDLANVVVTQSSGSQVLDDNAVNIIKRISPFPPFPPDLEKQELRITIPINYTIN